MFPLPPNEQLKLTLDAVLGCRELRFHLAIVGVLTGVLGCTQECPKSEALYLVKDADTTEVLAMETVLWVSTEGVSFSQDGPGQGAEILDRCTFDPAARVVIQLRAGSSNQDLDPVLIPLIGRLRELGVDFDASVTAAP